MDTDVDTHLATVVYMHTYSIHSHIATVVYRLSCCALSCTRGAGCMRTCIHTYMHTRVQVELLRSELHEERGVPAAGGEGAALEVSSADGFQRARTQTRT